ncbi:hypothetical protein DUHN55_29840 [Helicobacter pylori]|mgnify:CR=1 FL=1
MTTAAATKASGEAHRGASRRASTHTRTTGSTAHGLAAMPVTGPRHSCMTMPASIACATEAGIRVMSDPRAGTSPVARTRTPVTTKAPTAAGQPPSTVPVEASNAAPGVDHATVMGSRVVRERTIELRPMRIVTASSPLAACACVAPTAVSPCRTTTKALVKPTSTVTTPAVTGRRVALGMRTR